MCDLFFLMMGCKGMWNFMILQIFEFRLPIMWHSVLKHPLVNRVREEEGRIFYCYFRGGGMCWISLKTQAWHSHPASFPSVRIFLEKRGCFLVSVIIIKGKYVMSEDGEKICS